MYNFFEALKAVLSDKSIPRVYKKSYAEGCVPIFWELRNLWSTTKPTPSTNSIELICDGMDDQWNSIIKFIGADWDELKKHHLGIKMFRDSYILTNKKLEKFEFVIERWISALEIIDPSLK